MICMATCWGCKFDEHPGRPHMWMDVEDVEWCGQFEALAYDQPCNCFCAKGGIDVADND